MGSRSLAKLVSRQSTHKYGARKTVVDGITFASKAEADYYGQLKLLERAGEVIKFVLQPKFRIIDGYYHPTTGKYVQPSYYNADFQVWYKDGRQEIVDVKGVQTAVYRLKKKLFESKYGIPIKEVQA